MTNTSKNFITSIALIGLSIFVIYETSAYPVEVRLIPRLMAYIILFFSAVLAVKTIISLRSNKETAMAPEKGLSIPWGKIIITLALWGTALLTAPIVGFYVTMGLFWFILTWFLEGMTFEPVRIFKFAGFSMAIVLFLYLVFQVAVGIPTPKGWLV